MRLYLKHMYGGLFPIDETGQRFMSRLAGGDIVPVESKRPRNIKMHNKFWAMCAYIADNSEMFPTARHAEQWLLIKLGYCTVIGGKELPDSISFANMDQAAFDLMYDNACDLVCTMIPFVNDRNVRQVLAEFVGVGTLMAAE